MPNRSMPAAPAHRPGALLLGDAFNMRHPLTGGGMMVALNDIVPLRSLLKPLYLRAFYTRRKLVTSTTNILAESLYKIYCASPDPARNDISRACFDYMSLGGVWSAGFTDLISGLNPSPLSLLLHFIATAIYSVVRLLLPFPSLKRIWIAARFTQVALDIVFPIIKAEGLREIFFPATLPSYYRAPPLDSE